MLGSVTAQVPRGERWYLETGAAIQRQNGINPNQPPVSAQPRDTAGTR